MLATVVDIRHWLHEDAAQPMAVRHKRDRALALEHPLTQDTPIAQVLSWWQQLGADPAPDRSALVARIRMALRGGPLLLGLLGLAIGIGAASAGLAYDGSHPINLIAVLMLLVGLPALFLLLSLLLLPGRMPGLGWLQQLLASLNLGQWLTRWLRYKIDTRDTGQGHPGALGLGALNGWQATGSASARVGKWLMLSISQHFTIGYFVGALVALFALVSFSDLAFGWSTTLELSPQTVARWIQASAVPWAHWLPQAAPSLELVLQSQYFRAAGPVTNPQQLGAWWPYLGMCLLVYGLLPRLLLLLVSRWRLRSANQQLLLDDPQVTALLERLQTPWVERSISAPETNIGVGLDRPPARVALPPGTYGLVVWNQVAVGSRVEQWLQSVAVSLVGIPLELSGHRAATEGLAKVSEGLVGVENLLVVTKAWEPPLLELHDLLVALAGVIPAAGRVMVLPLSLALVAAITENEPVKDALANPLSETDESIWRQSIAALNSPKILLVSSDA